MTSAVAASRSKVLVLGVSYKRDLDDFRESPSIDVIRLLQKEGVAVSYHDPFVPSFEEHGLAMTGIALTPETLAEHDLVVIATDHRTVDYALVGAHARHVLDTRNAMKAAGAPKEKVTKL